MKKIVYWLGIFLFIFLLKKSYTVDKEKINEIENQLKVETKIEKKIDLLIKLSSLYQDGGKTINSPELQSDKANVYYQLAKAYSKIMNHQQAYYFLKKYSAIKDSLLENSIQKVQNKFENEKQIQDLEIYKLRIAKQNLLKWVLELSLLIFLILLIILYYFYFQTIKANKALKHEIQVRQKIQNELREAHTKLEEKVKDRTQQLVSINKELTLEISEREKVEKKLLKFQFIVNTSKEFMTMINKNYQYEAVNNAYINAIEKKENDIIGKTVADLWGKDQFEYVIKPKINEAFEGNEIHYKSWFSFRNDKKRFFDVTYYPFHDKNNDISHLVIVTRDITKQKEMEKQLSRKERLAALGELSEGVAHEIRNPVSIIKSNAQYCKSNFKEIPSQKLDKIMDIFIETSDRIDKTVLELIEYTKPKDIVLKQKNLFYVVENAISMVEEKCFSKNINLKLHSNSKNIIFLLDEKHLQKSIINLLLNAIDAQPNGGKIIVTLLEEKDSIILTIKDEGEGIDEKDIPKIFNPFYTTKPYGTGLGLSIVHQTVNDHYGNIDVISEKNKGTSIIITFLRNVEIL